MKKIFFVLCFISFISCKNDSDTTKIANITDPVDYERYLDKNEQSIIDQLKKNTNKLKSEANGDSTRIVLNAQIAGKLDQLFDLTGDVDYLNESVRFRESVAKKTYIKPEGARRGLAQSYIKQHRFKKADSLMSSFTGEYSSPASKLVQFDIAMELGEYAKAESLLDSVRNLRDYNYLIRAAKWNDHIGQLDTTISLMERAMELAEESGDNSKKIWSYSNIADYYGHNGQLEKSYDHYLKTLELDPNNTYALKGIAWIAYSNDRDANEARTILKRLQERHPIPDYNLELAEIESFEGNNELSKKLKNDFMKQVSNTGYGVMYNAYKISELIDAGETQKAVELAKVEVQNRATPETYDLLSYALLSNGQEKEALKIQEEYVIGKTFEPVAQLHAAMILKKNGKLDDVSNFKTELLETEYEMGPVTYKEIKAL